MQATLEVFLVFLRLGLTAFGGPIAHLAYFREEFVVRRGWLAEAEYADLVGLCQFLPGPASSQVGFALGRRRAGLAGGIAAFLGFTSPSFALMALAAGGLWLFASGVGLAVVAGLKLVAVAVVAHALYGMAKNLCRDRLTAGLAALALAALLGAPGSGPLLQPGLILAAGTIAALVSAPAAGGVPSERARGGARWGSWLAIALVGGLLAASPFLAQQAGSPLAQVADAFYRAGALVFGGGHVVLPLLEAETVGRGWLGVDQFLAGYGAAQALPGPLFTFAAFLGAAGGPGGAPGGLAGAAVATLAVFLPGLALVAAAAPLWESLKARPRAQGFVRGANACVVGVLGAALYDPIVTTGVTDGLGLAIAALGFVALQAFKAPAWAVVAGVGAAGTLAALG